MRNLIIFLAVCGFVVFLCFLNYYLLHKNLTTTNERADFGSMFGVTSALFSGLGYAGLIYTILLQNKSMKTQQEEYSKNSKYQHDEQIAFNKQLVSMNQTNKISALSALISIYSEDESRYQNTNKSKSDSAKQKKEELLKLIDIELKSHAK